MSTSTSERPRSRRGRRIAIAAVAIVVVLVVLVALAPMLVNLGLGQGLVRSAIADRVNGTVSFADLHVGWGGPQSINRLSVVDEAGTTVALVDARIEQGLLALLRNRAAPLELTLSGRLEGTIEADGSTSFARVVRSDPAAPQPAPGQPPLPAQAITLVLDGVEVLLHDARSQRDLLLEKVDGRVIYHPGAQTEFEIASPTRSGDLAGSMRIAAEAIDLVGAGGTLAPAGAALRFEAALESIPLLLTDDVDGTLRRLDLSVQSDDLSQRLIASVESEAALEQHEPSQLSGQLVLEAPVDAAGNLALALDRLSGTLRGERVPTALLVPLLAAAGLGGDIVPARDIGPLLDVEAVFAAAEGAFSVRAEAQQLTAQISGRMGDDRVVQLDPSVITATVAPELLAAFAPLRIDRPAALRIEIDSAALPAASGARAEQISGRGSVSISGPVQVAADVGERPWEATVEQLDLRFESESLAERLLIDGGARVDGGEVTLQEEIRYLTDDEGDWDIPGSRPIGRLLVSGLPMETIEPLLPDDARRYAAALGGPIDLAVTTEDAVHMRVTVQAQVGTAAPGEGWQLDLTAHERPDRLVISDGRIVGAVTADLAAAAQPENDAPIVPQQPATVRLAIDEIALPGDRASGWDLPEAELTGRLSSDRLVLERVPATVEPVAIEQLDVRIAVPLTGMAGAITAAGGLALRSAEGRPLGDVTVDIALRDGAPSGSLDVADADLGAWEQLLGRPPRQLQDWLGAQGGVALRIDPAEQGYAAVIEPRFPALEGCFGATVRDGVASITSEGAALTLEADAVQSLLGGADDDAAAADEPRLRVREPLPLQVSIAALRLPVAMLQGDAYDPAAVIVDLRAAGGPLALEHPDGTSSSLRDIEARLHGDFGGGLALQASAQSAVDGQAGSITIDGRIANLVAAPPDDHGAPVIDVAAALIDMQAQLEGLPTVIVDATAQLDGALVDALGQHLDAELTAEGLSGTGGTLVAAMRSEHGTLDAVLHGGDDALRSADEQVARAELELTEPLRQRLLARIHPIFADVRATEQPLRIVGSNLVIPLDGDVSRLNADLEITLGAVEIDSGSLLFGVLLLTDATDRQTIPGVIQPVTARIRDGVVSYDQFIVQLDKFALAYEGRINLNTRRVNLRTQVPLANLAMSVRELRGYADRIVVPIVTRGTFDDLKTQIDPEFDLAAAAAEAGFRGALNEILRGGDIGGLLDDLLKPKK